MTEHAKMQDGPSPVPVPFEELPLAERVKTAESFNAFNGIVPGWFIDARDTVNNWCVAEVLKVEGNEVKICYDGWSNKYDDTLKLRSYKLSPFRLFSKGYTGQVKIPLRRLVFSLEQLAEHRKKLEEVLDSDFKCLKTAFDVTQYLRGRLYTYVDFLMALDYKDPATEVPHVISFLKLVVKLIAAWLRLFPSYLKSFVEGQNCPKLMLVDRKVAFAMSGYEILDMLKWLFCLTHRTLVFFERYDVDVEENDGRFTKAFKEKFSEKRDKNPSITLLMERLENEEYAAYGLFVNFFNQFCQVGGLASVLDILSPEKLAEVSNAFGLTNYKLPLDVIAALLSPFKSIKPIAKEEVCKELVAVGKKVFFQRLEALEEKDIKDANKELMGNSLSHMRGILKLTNSEEEVAKLVQGQEMLISLKFLQSTSLEKRLNGLGDIKRLIDRVEYGQRFSYQQSPSKEKWFTPDYLVNWIIDRKILETILNENAHAELVRRTSHILIFLAKKKALTTGMIELLWKCQQDKHEDIIRSVHDTIRELIDYLSIEEVKYIHAKLKTIPMETYDEKLITFMKDFTLKAFAVHARNEQFEKMQDVGDRKDSAKADELEVQRAADRSVLSPSSDVLYCTPIFWTLLQDEANVPQEITELATGAFKETLGDPYSAAYRIQYMYLCMENIKNHRSVPQSMFVATYILSLVSSQKVIHSSSSKDWLLRLSKDYPIVDLVIRDLEYYCKLVEEKLAQGLNPAEVADKIVQGKHKHGVNMEQRLRFLQNLLGYRLKEIKMGNESVQRLWKLIMEESKLEYNKQQFLKWLSAEKESSNNVLPIPIFDKEENEFLFDIICKSRDQLSRAFDIFYYRCFAKHFKLVNSANGAVEIRRGRVKTMKIEALAGLDSLWENVCYNVHEGARGKFIELLIDVYTNLHESLQEKRKEIIPAFINRCMAGIIKADIQNEELIVTNLAKALLAFFELIDGSKYSEPDEADSGRIHSYTIVATLLPETTSKQLEVEVDVTVGKLRKKVAEAFDLPFWGFQMSSKIRVFEREDDDAFLRSVGWAQQVQVKRIAGEFTDPKKLLVENRSYITHLFLLLSKESSSYVEPVWELLMTLPSDQKMLADIGSLNVPAAEAGGWNALLDTKSVHKFLYSLQIIEEIVTPPQDMESVEVEIAYKKWISQFSKKEGLAHLFHALVSLPTASLHHPLTRKCFSLLLKVLHLIQTAGYTFEQFVPKYEALRETMVERVLTILEAFAQHSILPESEKSARGMKRAKSTKLAENDEEQQRNEKSQALMKKRKDQDQQSKAFEHGFALIKSSKALHYNYFDQMAKCSIFKDLLLKGLILSDNPFLKHTFVTELITICKLAKNKEYSGTHPHVVLAPFLLQSMIRETLHRDSDSSQFYQLVCTVVKLISKPGLRKLPINYHDLLLALSTFVKEHAVQEYTSKDTDHVIVGLLNTLEALLESFDEEKEFVGQACGLVQELLHRCLFEFPVAAKHKRTPAAPPPKCKSQLSRQASFNLLCVLARDCPANLRQIIEYVVPIHAKGAWRTKRMSDWMIMQEAGEKSTTGYVGLKNLGCTCYMNSLLQQFYMIAPFRNAILSVDPGLEDAGKKVSPEDNLLYQTQCLFAALNESIKQSYNLKIFCHAFKDWDGKSINVLEQMDVDEFFNLFLDKIEHVLKGTPQANAIKYHFGGVFANQLLCKDCPHNRILDEPFLALNLQVKNKKSLQQCLESFVEGEMLQGDNAYHCEKCDKKVTTLKRVCIKRLPRHLIFVLKRFDLNYDTMQKFKINDYCEFPMRLNMEAYTAEGLAKKDREKEREKAKKEGRDLEEDQAPPPGVRKVQYPPEYYEYKLTGVVIHTGTADGGHYYSLIMDREKDWLPEKERWFEFNDTLVDHYDPEDIKDDAFGGEEKMHGFDGMSMRLIEKIRNAYLLVYERVTPYDPPEEDEDGNGGEANKVPKTATVAKKADVIAGSIHSAIIAENIKYWYNKYMFHEDYLDFALKLCSSWNSSESILRAYPSKNCDYALLGLGPEVLKAHAYQISYMDPLEPGQKTMAEKPELKDVELQVFKYAATLLLTTVFRAHTKPLAPDYIDLVKAYINKRVEAAQWLIWQFTNSKVLFEFLLECGEIDMRRFAVGLLYCAMLKTYESEKEQIAMCVAGKAPKSVLINFANFVFQQLSACRKFTIHFEHFFQLISRLAILGPEIREYFLRTGAVKRLLGFWGSFAETNWNNFSDIPCTENTNVELGLPSDTDERFQSPFEEYFSLKREKIFQQAQPFYTFLFEALSLILRSTTLDESLPSSRLALSPSLKGVGIDPMTKNILLNPKNLGEMMRDCRRNLAMVCTAQAFCHLSWENPEFKLALLKAAVQNINALDHEDPKNYYFFLKELLKEDSPHASFVETVMKELDSLMRSNQGAFYATVHGVKNMIAMAREVKSVAEWLRLNVDKWKWVIDWLRQNPYPSMSDQGVEPYKSKAENLKILDGYDFSYTAEGQSQFKAYIQNLEESLDKIREGKLQEEGPVPKSISTVYYDKFYKNQTVEYLDSRSQTWYRAVVQKVLDEMVYVRPERASDSMMEWLEVDGDCLAREGTHAKDRGMGKDELSDDSPIKPDSDDGGL